MHIFPRSCLRMPSPVGSSTARGWSGGERLGMGSERTLKWGLCVVRGEWKDHVTIMVAVNSPHTHCGPCYLSLTLATASTPISPLPPGLPTTYVIKSKLFHCPHTLSLSFCCNRPLTLLQTSPCLLPLLAFPAASASPPPPCPAP